jgi:hypothetical protein
MCKWRWDAGVQLQFTQRLDFKHSKHQGPKRKWPLTSTLFIFFTRPKKNGCPYSCIKIHAWSPHYLEATAWHSLVIITREGTEQKRGGGELEHEEGKEKHKHQERETRTNRKTQEKQRRANREKKTGRNEPGKAQGDRRRK